MAQQLASVEYYESRAMRNWVGLSISRALPHGLPTQPDADALDLSAALCQIFDSIYLDIPMSRVKFNVNTEYAYLQNFKILQSKEYLFEALRYGLIPLDRLLYETRHRSTCQRRTTYQM
jgi:hypothetical protein